MHMFTSRYTARTLPITCLTTMQTNSRLGIFDVNICRDAAHSHIKTHLTTQGSITDDHHGGSPLSSPQMSEYRLSVRTRLKVSSRSRLTSMGSTAGGL